MEHYYPQEHGYGSRQAYRDELDESSQGLVASIGWLEGSLLVYLLDLPGLTSGPESHYIWGDPAAFSAVERIRDFFSFTCKQTRC